MVPPMSGNNGAQARRWFHSSARIEFPLKSQWIEK